MSCSIPNHTIDNQYFDTLVAVLSGGRMETVTSRQVSKDVNSMTKQALASAKVGVGLTK